MNFREAADACCLVDMGYTGPDWTWEKKVSGSSYTRVRLDRVLATPEWSLNFPMVVVRHVHAACSDHCALWLRLEVDSRAARLDWLPKLFRYETMWEAHDNFGAMLESKWGESRATNSMEMTEKLARLSGSLQAWGKDEFGCVVKEIKKLRETVDRLREAPGRRGPTREEIKAQDRLAELYHREEIMWRQRSRVLWLKEGDRNTRFFQQKATQRKKKNKISTL